MHDTFQKLTGADNDRFIDEDSDRRKSFAKSRKCTLPVKDITIPNDYRPLDYDKLKELLPDFETRGIKERIEVHERGSQYILLHGRLRLAVARRLDLDEIKVVAFSDEYYKPKAEPRKKPKAPLPNELELVKKAHKGDEEARNRLINHYYWLAVSRAYKHRRKMEREEASGVAFDAINKAIETWDPKKAKLSTWIGQKVQGELTTARRAMRKQQARDLTWIEPEIWIRRNRKNTKVTKLADDQVRIERLDDPEQYVIAKIKKRKPGIARMPEVIWSEKEIAERTRRRQVRTDLRLNTLSRILTGTPRFDAWLKQRKGADKQDQTIAKMLFCETHHVEWVEQIGRKRYLCELQHEDWLPDEICEELGITRSKLKAAVTRICKTVIGVTDKELLALDDAKQAEREARVRFIPVPAPNLPRSVLSVIKAIGLEPTPAEAMACMCFYWLKVLMNPGERYRDLWSAATEGCRATSVDDLTKLPAIFDMRDELRQIADRVADAIRDKAGPEYSRLGECCAVIKRHT